MKHEDDGVTNCNWRASNRPQKLGKEARRVGNWRMNQDYINYSILGIGQNTEKSPRDLMRFAVIQTPVKDHQVKLV